MIRRGACSCLNRVGSDALNMAKLEASLVAHGHSSDANFHGQEPFYAFVPSSAGEVGGRFFPSRNACLVFACGNVAIERATLNHELAHAMQYAARCGGTAPTRRASCEYMGQHDAMFYRMLESMHRASGVKPKDARVPEGNYKYPARWQKDDAW